MEIKNKFLNTLINLDYVIAGASLITLITITFLGVLMRYFFSTPFIWQEEVQLWCFMWIVFFGAGAAFRTGNHIAIDILVDSFPIKLKKVVEIFNYVVVTAVLIYFYKHSSTLVEQMIKTGRTTNILKINYAIIYRAFPIGCLLMILNQSLVLFSKVKLDKQIKEEIDTKENIKGIGEKEWI